MKVNSACLILIAAVILGGTAGAIAGIITSKQIADTNQGGRIESLDVAGNAICINGFQYRVLTEAESGARKASPYTGPLELVKEMTEQNPQPDIAYPLLPVHCAMVK